MKVPARKFKCLDCNYEFEVPFGIPKWNIKCEKCNSSNIVRVDIGFNSNEIFPEEEKMRNNESLFGRFFSWCRGWKCGFGRGRGCGWKRGWNKGLGRGSGKGRGWGKCW